MKPARLLSLVIGCLALLPALALLFGGGILGLGYLAEQDDDGYFDVGIDRLSTDGVAITAGEVDLRTDPGDPDWVLDVLDTELRLRVTGERSGDELFLGIARQADLDDYLSGVAHDEVVDLDDNLEPTYDFQPGADFVAPPAEQTFWAASSEGSGTQQILWEASSGRWAAAILNADGSAGLAATANVGARAGFILPLSLGMLSVGTLLTAFAGLMIAAGVRQPHHDGPADMPPPQTSPDPVFGPAARPSPVALSAALDPELSRWLWLVKWFLAIPHFIALAFLWAMYLVLTLLAGIAILFTGRYPRGIFAFNVGVLRWTWRVSYYATTGGLGSDRYPPFSTAAEPGDHAHLDVDFPPVQPRASVLYRWLLAIPHLLIVAALSGTLSWSIDEANISAGTSLLGLLVVIAGGILLFTGRYPSALFGLIVGLNRWIYRVIAYLSFMTNSYPPFRLDQGGVEPSSPHPDRPSEDPTAIDLVARDPSELVSP